MPLEPKSDKGYLVPDNPNPTQFDYRLIKIPSDPQWRETYSYLIGVLTFGYVWDKDSGDYEAAITTAMDILNCFIGLGIDCMTICEIVSDCITNDAMTQIAIANAIGSSNDIQTAIGNYIKQSGYNTPTGGLNTNSDTITTIGAVSLDSPIGVIANCDNDKLWGALRFGVVKYLEDNAVNFLEDLNTIADKGQRANSIIGGIPIIGDVLSATISAFVEAIPDLLNLFNSYASETTQNNAACELFQIGCNTCELPTYRQLLNYYGNLGVTGFDDLSDVAFQLATDLMIGSSTLTGAVVYHTMIAYEIMTLYLGSRFNQALGINIIDTWALIGVPFGNDTWIALCGGCGDDTWAYCYDFSIDNQEWRGTLNSDTWLGAIRPNVATEPASIYSNPAWGEKFVTTLQTFDDQTLSQIIDDWTLTPVNVDTLTITMNYTKGQFDTNGYAWLVRYRRDGDVGFTDAPSVSNASTTDGLAIQHTFNINETNIAEICISIRCSINNLQSGVAEILHLEVVGNGANTPPNAMECA